MNESHIGYLIMSVVAVVGLLLFSKRRSGSGTSNDDAHDGGGVAQPDQPDIVYGDIDASKVTVLWETDAPRIMSVGYDPISKARSAGEYRTGSRCYVWAEGSKIDIGAGESAYDQVWSNGELVVSGEKLNVVKSGRTGAVLAKGMRSMVTATREVESGKWASVSATNFPAPHAGIKGDVYFKRHDSSEIRLSGDGVSFCRDMFQLGDYTCIASTKYHNPIESGLYITKDYKGWKWDDIFSDDQFRPMNAVNHNGDVYLTFSKYVNRQRVAGGCVKLSVNSDGAIKYTVDAFDQENGGWFDIDSNGKALVACSLMWNGKGYKGVAWIKYNGGKWQKLYVTDGDGEVLSCKFTDYNTVLLGVKEHGHGKFIEIGDISQRPESPLGSRTKMPDEIRYKVRSGHDVRNGNLVILLPSSYNADPVIMGVGTPKEERGEYVGRSNGNRPTYRFDHPGFYWDSPCPINVGEHRWYVEDTAWDNRYGYDYVK